MDVTATRLLDWAPACLLVAAGAEGPLVAPLAQWFDGRSVWLAATSASPAVAALAARPSCTVCVPGPDVVAVATGEARTFGLADPVGLALHAGPISGALAALAARHAASLAGYARDAALQPSGLRARGYGVVRVRIDDATVLPELDPPPGLAPALPAAVPGDIRRAVSGERRVLVAHGPEPRVVPATWDADLTVSGLEGPLAPAGPVAVTVLARSVDARGLALQGRFEGARLRASRASWWRGYDVAGAPLPEEPVPGVALPD